LKIPRKMLNICICSYDCHM